MKTEFIDNAKIYDYLKNTTEPELAEVEEILAHARELQGISYSEAERLLMVENDDHLHLMHQTANFIKEEIYGKRLVMFAPLYVSNLCNNECLYCAFKRSNNELARRTLSFDEIRQETEALINQGHKRMLLVSGEGLGLKGLDYTLKAIDTIYGVRLPKGNIRRINVNIAAQTVEGFKQLQQAKIGTYQLFQETYNFDTYSKMHLSGPKADYNFHLTAMDRAIEAGIQDVGVGILFGLEDYRFEIMALLQHIHHLEDKFGVGPHTISVPRIEPATNSEVSLHPPHAVDDRDFKKILAVLRITVPYTGMILSTRENAEIRRDAFYLGVSQISGGSRTNPGGYSSSDSAEQFSLGDHRSLLEVIKDVVAHDHLPRFCTGCYRLGRVGKDFMDLAKPGEIKTHCYPNAVFTFAEYLEDFADDELKKSGYDLISRTLDDGIKIPALKAKVLASVQEIKNGKRDIYL